MARKPKHLKAIHYYCELYRTQFVFLIGWPADALRGFLAERYGAHPDRHVENFAGITMRHVHEGAEELLVWAADAEDFATVAHECLHAANRCLAACGVETTNTNDEALAYLMTLLIKKAAEK